MQCNPALLYLWSLGRAVLAALIIALIAIVTKLVKREANLSRWQFTDFSAGHYAYPSFKEMINVCETY